MTDTTIETSVYTAAREAARLAFDDARLADDEARAAFNAVGRDAPQDVYVTALRAHQQASELATQCAAGLAAATKAAAIAAEAGR